MEWEQLLNEQQLKGVRKTDGAVLVVAGAGSGKTRVLTYRIAYLLEQGVSPYRILAITFTNKATKEMQERIETLCPTAQGLWISTFHSFCSRVLRRDIDKLGYTKDFSIYDDVESKRVCKRVIENKHLDPKAYLDRITWHISYAKNKGWGPDAYAGHLADHDKDLILDVYEGYEEAMKIANALDYDDLLLKTVELFCRYPEVLVYYQERFQYVHIDEYQDTNRIQYALVKLIVKGDDKGNEGYGNIFAVGDEDQSIYGWRGADINNILDFRKDFEGAEVIKLEQNYRSTGNILAAANALIANNKGRFGKKLWTSDDKGEAVSVERCISDSEEADYVIRQIGMMIRSGRQPQDFAILVRLNALTNKFEERLTTYNIPYKVFGGFKFFERKEIKDILAYLRLIVNVRDNEAFLRIVNTPKRGIGDTVVDALLAYATARNLTLMEVLFEMDSIPEFSGVMRKKLDVFRTLMFDLMQSATEMGVAQLAKLVYDKAGFGLLYAGEDEESYNKRLNVDELLQSMTEFEQDNPTAGLSEYLQSVTLSSDTDDIQSDNFVTLATVHAVKGLEFPVVFVVGLEENVFPSGAISKTDVEIEEERRVMYVAMTRARQKLYLTYAADRFRFGRHEQNRESRFITEIRAELGLLPPKPPKRIFSGVGQQTSTGQSYDPNQGEKYTVQYTQPTARPRPVSTGISVGMLVEHPKFGRGRVIIVNGDNATIAFEGVGVKTLSLKIAPLKVIK